MKKRLMFFAFIISSIFTAAFSEDAIGFFKTVSQSEDQQTIKLTEDVYFSKINMISDYAVIDCRTEEFSFSKAKEFPDLKYAIYAEIQEEGSEWKCILHCVKISSHEQISSEKEYESYYNILMNAKEDVNSFFARIGNMSSDPANASFSEQSSSSGTKVAANLDNLSGTWKGEEYIDKIIIMRGGKGFVVFQNGAYMNILVKVVSSNLVATQNCSPNASFFPEISRETALQMAPDAKPIEWNLKIVNNSTLEGTKVTLFHNGGNVEYTPIHVKWTREN